MRQIDAIMLANLDLNSVNHILTNDGKIWMKIAIKSRIEDIYIQFLNYFTSDNGIFRLEKA